MKLSDLSDQEWFDRLQRRRNLNFVEAQRLFQYYDGEQPSYWLARLLEEQDDRFPPLNFNWHQLFIDTLDGLCVVEGFANVGEHEHDSDLWAAWTRNDMPEFESENNINSLVAGSGYVVVGPESDGALVTVESPEQMAIEIDPRTRKTVASLLFYKSDSEATRDDHAVLQVANPDGTSRLVEFENGKAVGSESQKWMTSASRLQTSPEVPVVRFLNRQRKRIPRSELLPLIPVTNAANLIATHMMATSSHHAMPRMLAINVAESLFLHDDGSINKEAVKQATGALWVVPSEVDKQGKPLPPDQAPKVDIKQLPASDLRNFHESLSLLARIGAGLCSMSPADFGFGVADNPESAKGREARHQSMATRVRRVHASRGSAYARVMRLVAAVEGRDPAALSGLETRWRDPAKLTKAAMADAAAKTLGSGISDLHQARVDYGYTPAQIAEMEKRERLLVSQGFGVPGETPEDPESGV